MDEFDIDLSDIGGSSINNLNNSVKPNTLETIRSDRNKLTNNRPSDFIDFKDNSNIYKPKKNVNMNNLIKNLESDLKKYSYNSDEILGNDNIPAAVNENPQKKIVVKDIKTNTIQKSSNNDKIEILIYILIFMILNNKFIIDLIFNYVPYIKNINNPYPNLLIRSLLFGILLYFYKKYYTNN
jgi:hypothetical protein